MTGLNANVIHVAAGMTYALALIGAVALAVGRARGWAAVIGGCIAAGIMLDPQGADGVLVLLSSPDHIGTSVPMMLAWLILDRTRPSWAAAAAVSVVLALAGLADSLVTYAAIAPLVLVVAVRLVLALRRDRTAGWRSALAERRYEIGLAVGAIAAAIAARLALRLIAALGGFGSPAPVSSVGSVSHILDHNVPVVAHGLLLLFGADFLDYPVGVVLVLHLVSVLLVVVGIAVTCWHFLSDLDLVAQLLLAGIVINVSVFVVSTAVSGLPTMREIGPVLPFSAALAGRQLGPWLGDALAARRRRPGRRSWLPRSVATGLLVALGLRRRRVRGRPRPAAHPPHSGVVRAAARLVAGGPPPRQRRGRLLAVHLGLARQRRQGPDPASRHRLPAAPAEAGQGGKGGLRRVVRHDR